MSSEAELFVKMEYESNEESEYDSDDNIALSKLIEMKGKNVTEKLKKTKSTKLPKTTLDEEFECSYCKKLFINEERLRAHEKVHGDFYEHVCGTCGKGFHRRAGLTRHLSVHNGPPPQFECNHCKKIFDKMCKLRTHLKIHSDVHDHVCDVCGKGFYRKLSLTNHKTIHTGACNFSCDYCYKPFKTRESLKRHKRLHTGERPYSCLECNHHFADSSNYIKHMRKWHGGYVPTKNFTTCKTTRPIKQEEAEMTSS